jgi:hypothetical protein
MIQKYDLKKCFCLFTWKFSKSLRGKRTKIRQKLKYLQFIVLNFDK